MLRHVDLCSGIGGFSLGFSWAELSKTIMFCDTEKWCRQILNQNFPNIPIATDVKELANDARRLVPECDILTAGYPCQPFSVAGKQKGTADDRHIWPYILRIIQQERFDVCVFENVSGHIKLGLDTVISDLESEGYSTRTFNIPASGVGAWHQRKRIWIIGHNVSNTNSGELLGCMSTSRLCGEKLKGLDSNEEKDRNEVWGETERCGEQVADRGNVPNSTSKGLENNVIQSDNKQTTKTKDSNNQKKYL